MQKLQIKIIRTYLLITFFLVGYGNLFPANQNLWLFRYFTILSLFLIAFFHKVKERILTRLPYALLFVAIGDAFLYLSLPLKFIKLDIPLGLISFSIAYIIIASAYLKALFSSKRSPMKVIYLIQLVLSILTVSIAIYFLRKTHLDYLVFGSFFISTLLIVLFSALIIFFCTIFSKRLKLMILISSTLMVICDIGVILGFSLVSVEPMAYNLGASIVWSAYVPAWTIICILSMDAEFNRVT